MDSLENLALDIAAIGLPGELWIDGSFLTEKIDPKDVDLVLRTEAAALDSATPDQVPLIEAILHRRLVASGLDTYLFPEWPSSHPLFPVGQERFAYWDDFFTHDRDRKTKGLAVVKLASVRS